MMKLMLRSFIRAFFLAGFFLLLFTQNGMSREKPLGKISIALQWLTQCQFAGYYVALDQGFYRQEGIDLTIIPGAPDINPIYLVSSEIADFGTKWLADFIVAKEKAFPIISIAQVLQSNGLVLIAKAKSGIQTPQDFIGKRIGIWFFGNETQFLALMNKLDIPNDQMDIDAIKWSIQPFLDDEFDVVMAMMYNEYLRVLDSGYKQSEINIIDFAKYGLNFPGQTIFTRINILKKRPDLCERMLRASLRGWAWAIDHPEAAVDIVMKYDETKTLNRDHQLRQMKIVINLIKYGDRSLGYHLPEQVAFVMENLLQNRIISAPMDLSEIYTNEVWEKAKIVTEN